MVVLGAIIGGFVASNYMSDNTVEINPRLVQQLAQDFQIESAGKAYLPTEIFGLESLSDPSIILILLVGGIWLVLEHAMQVVVRLAMRFLD